MYGLLLKALPWASSLLKTASLPLVTFVAGALLAGFFVSDRYESELKEQALSMALARAEQGKRNHEKVVELTDKLDALERDSASLRDTLDRVRVERAKRSAKTPEGVDCSASARCEELLERGAELLERCSQVLQDNALKHDALSEVYKSL